MPVGRKKGERAVVRRLGESGAQQSVVYAIWAAASYRRQDGQIAE